MSGREERERAVELYFTTSMSTKQVVEHLGYPTRQCLERWLRDDPRYADAVPKPPIPLETRCRAVELCLSGMQQKQVATELGVSAGAVHHWMRLYRAGLCPMSCAKAVWPVVGCGFSRLSAWCHRAGTCPGSGGPSSRR